MSRFLRFVDNNTLGFYAICVALGLTIRFAMVHGDWGLFLGSYAAIFTR